MKRSRNGLHCEPGFSSICKIRNKKSPFRLSLEEKEYSSREGGDLVVKGVSRRVIVVKAPDERIFEQAIFIIREDFAAERGYNEKEILRQARKAANEYLHRGEQKNRLPLRRLSPPLYAAAGAAATGIAWLAVQLVH